MRVKALFNKGEDIPKSCLAEYSSTKDKIFPLEIGKSYLVYAIAKFGSCMWYHIIDEYFSFPALNPAPLFSIEDNRISRYWKCYHEYDNTRHSDYFRLAFDEWISVPDFFDSLIEGYEPATSIFNKYQELMTLEFPDKTKNDALLLDADNWVMCPSCDDAWQVDRLNGLLRCPKCSLLLNNPFYPSF